MMLIKFSLVRGRSSGGAENLHLYSHDTLSSVVLQYPSRAFWPHRQITLFVENLRSTEREEWLEAVLGKAISVKTLVIRWRFIGGNRRTIAGLVWQVNGIARAS